jgi:hypothetical protein
MNVMKRNRRSLFHLAAIIGLIGMFAYGCATAEESWPQRWPQEAFTPDKWQAIAPEQRYRLVKDLANRRLLDGKTRSFVLDTLGKPTYEASKYMTYLLRNAEPGEYTLTFVYLLHIQFEKDRVSRYFLRTD